MSSLLDVAYESLTSSLSDLKIRGRVIRKRRAVGLIPLHNSTIPRESLDECVLRVQGALRDASGSFQGLPYCAFNGGRDAWVDCGNKRVGVSVLQTYLGLRAKECLHVGDQFLNTGNDYAARGCSPCCWITGPGETAYILKKMLMFAGGIDIDGGGGEGEALEPLVTASSFKDGGKKVPSPADMARRSSLDASDPAVTSDISKSNIRPVMDVYTGDIIGEGGRKKKKMRGT